MARSAQPRFPFICGTHTKFGLEQHTWTKKNNKNSIFAQSHTLSKLSRESKVINIARQMQTCINEMEASASCSSNLLIERGAEVDARDKFGWTPLHYASKYGHLEISRVLIDHGADVNTRQRHHVTPMHISVENGRLGVVKLLLERGADIHALDSYGQSPYQVSVAYGYREIAVSLLENGAGRARFEEIFL